MERSIVLWLAASQMSYFECGSTGTSGKARRNTTFTTNIITNMSTIMCTIKAGSFYIQVSRKVFKQNFIQNIS